MNDEKRYDDNAIYEESGKFPSKEVIEEVKGMMEQINKKHVRLWTKNIINDSNVFTEKIRRRPV